MQTATRGTLSLLAAFLAAVSVLTVAADGATLKHKKTGQTITGTLTEQKINQRRGFKLENGSLTCRCCRLKHPHRPRPQTQARHAEAGHPRPPRARHRQARCG